MLSVPPQPGTNTITATAPNAAKRSTRRHASTDVIAPPSDMPVEKTRFVSTQKSLRCWSSSAPHHRHVVLQALLAREVEVSAVALTVGRDDQEVVAVGERLEVAVQHLLHGVGPEPVEVEDDRYGFRPVVGGWDVELVRAGLAVEVERLAV